MNKTNASQISALSKFLSRALFLGYGISLILVTAKESSWLSILLGTIIGLFFISMISFVRNKQNDKNIFEILKEMKFIGYIISIGFLIFSFLIIISSMLVITHLVSMMFLTKTSASIIVGSFALIVLFAIYKDFSTITRVAFIIFFLYVVLLLFGAAPLIGKVNINNFLPLFNTPLINILKAALTYGTLSAIPYIFLLVISKNNVINSKKNDLYKSYLFSSLIIAIPCLITLGILGKNLAAIYAFPEYIVLRRISLLNFIENIENIIAFAWIFDVFMLITTCFFFIKENFKIMYTKKHANKLITSIIIVMYIIVAFYLKISYSFFNTIGENIVMFTCIAFLVLFSPVYIYTLIKKRNN